MTEAEFKRNQHWALRTSTKIGARAVRVTALEFIKTGKAPNVKVRYEDGTVSVVPSHQLRSTWSRWLKVQAREEGLHALDLELQAGTIPAKAHLLAADEVLRASGEDWERSFLNWRLSAIGIGGMNRVLARSGLESNLWEKYRYAPGERGSVYVEASFMIDVARAFAAAEPETVGSRNINEEWMTLEQRREQYRDVKAKKIIESWLDADLGEPGQESLKALLLTAINELRKAGLNGTADQIESEMKSAGRTL